MSTRPPPSSPGAGSPRNAVWAQYARGRPARRPPPSAGSLILKALARHRKSGEGPAAQTRGPRGRAGSAAVHLAQIARHWPDIVGTRIAALSTPERVSGRAGARVLHIIAAGPAGVLLEAESRKILERVNGFCGDRALSRLAVSRGLARTPAREAPAPAVKIAPRAALKIAQTLEPVGDPRLKAALETLGRSVWTANAARVTRRRS